MTSSSALRFLRTSLLIGTATGLGLWGWTTIERIVYQHRGNVEFEQQTGQQIKADSLVGRIEIPRLGVNALVREGTGATTLRLAAGHIPGTALPGEKGNVAVAAHRDSLFRGLKDVRKDDSVVFQTANGKHVYRVESMVIVDPDDVAVLKASAQPELTLVTCYPFSWIGSAPQRFVVKAREVSDNSPPLSVPVSEVSVPHSRENSPENRVYFQIPLHHSRELAPGISMGVTSIDMDSQTASGWM
jgi:LPXTG-site transpeptidase (sortase) family protein